MLRVVWSQRNTVGCGRELLFIYYGVHPNWQHCTEQNTPLVVWDSHRHQKGKQERPGRVGP